MFAFMQSTKNWAGFRVFLRFFDAISAFLLVGIGNTLENVFRGTTMSRVLSSTLRVACIMTIFEICFASGLLIQVHDFVKNWESTKYFSQ